MLCFKNILLEFIILFLFEAPVSYRLGNQRRLKYAPPPDLTTNNAKPSPAVQTFFPTQNVSAPPNILNPFKSEGSVQDNNSSVQQTSSLPEQLPKFEQLSGNSSLRSSFRLNPVATETTYNSSVAFTTQNQFSESSSVSTPSQFVSSLSRPIPAQILEPATPQNTPANISFPGFTPYVNRDFLPESNLDREVAAFKKPNQSKSLSEFSRDGIPETTTESAHKASLISEETKATFTPILAAKVTEKLEHLLAEQKQDSSCVTTSETFPKIDEISSSISTELTKSFEAQSETPLATNEFIDESHKVKLNDVQKKTAQPGSDTWSDVFLGQEPAAESVICPEVHTDNNPVVTDNQAAESNIHLPQQYFQLQSTSMPSTAVYADRPADQRSSLNYVPPVQLPQSSFYNPSKPTEQSASVFFESTKPDGFLNFSQETNINPSYGQPSTLIIDATKNSQQVQEKSAFNSTAINSTVHVPFWNADQSSQSQVLNVSNQPVYNVPSQSPTPTFYNPAQFTNELPKPLTFSHTYNQQFSQQKSYQNPPLYENTSGIQQSYTAHEDNTAYSSPAVSMVTAIPEPTGSATLNPIQMSVNAPIRTIPDTVPPSFQNWVKISCAYYINLYFLLSLY